MSVPPGEAPIEIREAWVGLELPLLRERPGRFLGSGVLSGPRSVGASLFRLLTFRSKLHRGYVVGSLASIEVLEKSNPMAASWWREHTPHLVRARRFFIFPTECCRLIE
jgi:hypothetical protein